MQLVLSPIAQVTDTFECQSQRWWLSRFSAFVFQVSLTIQLPEPCQNGHVMTPLPLTNPNEYIYLPAYIRYTPTGITDVYPDPKSKTLPDAPLSTVALSLFLVRYENT